MSENQTPNVTCEVRDRLLADAKELDWVARHTLDPALKAHFQRLAEEALAAAKAIIPL